MGTSARSTTRRTASCRSTRKDEHSLTSLSMVSIVDLHCNSAFKSDVDFPFLPNSPFAPSLRRKWGNGGTKEGTFRLSSTLRTSESQVCS